MPTTITAPKWRPDKTCTVDTGGKPKANAYGQMEARKKMLDFLNKAFGRENENY
jgi:hypothetical protein